MRNLLILISLLSFNVLATDINSSNLLIPDKQQNIVSFIKSKFTKGESTEFNREQARKMMLDLYASPPVSKLKITGLKNVDKKKKKFLNYFKQHIAPHFDESALNSYRFALLYVMSDRALQNDDAELEAWSKEKLDLQNRMVDMSNDPKWKEHVKTWKELSHGLKGELAEVAREMYRSQKLSTYDTEELIAKQKRLNEITEELKKITNSSEFGGQNLAKAAQAAEEVELEYVKGNLDFEAAWKKLEKINETGSPAFAQDVAVRGEALFNEMAILRTELANAKGFDNYAQYRFATQKKAFTRKYQGLDNIRNELAALIESTDEIYDRFLKQRVTEIPGADYENLRSSQNMFLRYQADAEINEYFPLGKLESIWKKTMIESGFTEEELAQVHLDSFPREGKQTHAYMYNMSDRTPKVFELNGHTLNAVVPKSNDDWIVPHIFIVQNLKTDGIDGLTTMLHEGGHAMEYSWQENLLKGFHSTAHAEIASQLLERFAMEIDFLLENGQKANGEKLTREIAQKFIDQTAMNALMDRRTQVGYSIYELDLWNHAYTRDGESFMERNKRLTIDTMAPITKLKSHAYGDVSPAYRFFNTDHFYGGRVGYFGYTFADAGASMIYDYLKSKLGKSSGRAAMFQQKELANILRNEFYKDSFTKPFPSDVEEMVGEEYKLSKYGEEVTAPILEYLSKMCK